MSFKRQYAFEAEGVSEEVKTQLEAVEKSADEKCETPADCDKILDKIDTQAEKFDDALSAMAGAAKDCKDGKCDEGEMASRITPAQAELKAVAKTIGVASEAEGVTEEELKDVKDYLEGAKEIIEAKKDELDDGKSGGDGKCPECGKDPCECETEEKADESYEVTVDDLACVEAFGMCADEVDYALEAYMDALDDIGAGAISMAAMEGANVDAVNTVRQYLKDSKAAKSEMKAAVKSKDYKTAAAKAREVAGHVGKMESSLNAIPASVGSAVIANIALALIALLAVGAIGALAGKGAEAAKKTGLYKKAAGKIEAHKKAVAAAAKERRDDAYDRLQRGEETKEDMRIINKQNKGASKVGASNTKARHLAERVADKALNKENRANLRDQRLMDGAPFAKTRKAVGDTMDKIGNAASAAGKTVGGAASTAGNAIKTNAPKVGKVMSVGVGAVGGAGGAGNVLYRALKKAKAVDADGNPVGGKLDANDFNALIAAIKTCAAGVKKHYEKLASEYDRMASGATSATEALEAFYGDLEYDPALESIGATTGFQASGDEIDNFVAACESLKIGSRSSSTAGSFLFGD